MGLGGPSASLRPSNEPKLKLKALKSGLWSQEFRWSLFSCCYQCIFNQLIPSLSSGTDGQRQPLVAGPGNLWVGTSVKVEAKSEKSEQVPILEKSWTKPANVAPKNAQVKRFLCLEKLYLVASGIFYLRYNIGLLWVIEASTRWQWRGSTWF